MPRKLRIQSDEIWYHIMNRGVAKRAIFMDDNDRARFVALLADAHKQFDFQIHAYCLMGNHYHLMGHTPRANIAQIMHRIDGVYTQGFNRKYRRDGPLFRGRYHSVLLTNEAHWMCVSRYVHRNPVEGGFVRRPQDYRWSSYRAYAGLARRPDWLITDYVIAAMSTRQSRVEYRQWVEADGPDDPLRGVPLVPDPSGVPLVPDPSGVPF